MLIPPLPNFSYDSAPNFDPTTQIRLLKLHRRVPFFEVSAELVSCAIEEAPTYYAISYVWSYGRQDFRTITLNGMSFKIRRNVYDILNRCSSFLGPQTIWIDTICIDQSNNDEKTFQVRAMQDIYSTAEHVLVCLGNGPEYVAQFFERRKTDPWLAARIDALQELLQHPWFRRVWVIQEAVVPRAV
ncbi:HET-domain-containing protein, partial [Bimuria novae-zelandiae CBS 107.79]